MAIQLLESSFITCLTHCNIHKWSPDNSGSLDDIFPAAVGLNSLGRNIQSVTLSVSLGRIIFLISHQIVTLRASHCLTGLHCFFNIMLETVNGSISLILIEVTRVKRKFANLMLFLILLPCLCIKLFSF